MLTIVGANVAILTLLGAFVWHLRAKHGSFLQLGILFALNIALDYPVRVLVLAFFPDGSMPSYPGLLYTGALASLSLLQFLGIAAFCCGYLVVERRYKAHAILSLASPGHAGFSFGLIAFAELLSIAAKGYKIATGNYVSFLLNESTNYRLLNIIENIHMLGWLSLAGVWLLWFRKEVRTPGQFIIFGIVNAVELSYQVIQGSKTFMLLPPVIILAAYHYHHRRLPTVGIIGTCLFAVLFVFPFVTTYRDTFGSAYAGIPSFSAFDPSATVRDTYMDTKGEHRTFGERILVGLSRFAGADELYDMEAMVPGVIPYKHGHDLLAILYGPIPRAVWAAKPIISPAAEYGEAMGTITSITPFPLGEMYWNAGGPGVGLGMCLWGILLALLMRAFDLAMRWPHARMYVVCIFLSQLYWLTTGEAMLSMILASLPKQVALFAIVFGTFALVIRPKQRRARPYLEGAEGER